MAVQILYSLIQLPSSQRPSSYRPNDGFHQTVPPSNLSPSGTVQEREIVEERGGVKESKRREDQLPILAVFFTIFRKSLVACKATDSQEICSMEIGLPTNVQHVAHVTFDRFNGFLGLPIEFEPEVPCRVPSASANVFGVSTESMQLSYDSRGNCVPTILLSMQSCLYAQGGLQAEGIFRINADNGQEEYVREQLNVGIVPDGVDVHCLAGLIKAWFRELPTGVLDSLTQEQIMQCHSEEECVRIVKLLPPTEAALLDWVVNLMTDVVLEEQHNKMNAHNIAMVFAPNMTQMADPLTALMYVVQVMNFLKMLITNTLKGREQSSANSSLCSSCLDPPSGGGHDNHCLLRVDSHKNTDNEPIPSELVFGGDASLNEEHLSKNCENSSHKVNPALELSFQLETSSGKTDLTATGHTRKKYFQTETSMAAQAGNSNSLKGNKKVKSQATARSCSLDKPVGINIISRLNATRAVSIEAWR